MSTKDGTKSIKNTLNGRYQAAIMVNLNMMLSKFLATLRLKATKTEMKNGVAYKNQNVHQKINIYLNQATTLPFMPMLPLYKNQSLIYGANQSDGFYTTATLN